MSLFCRITCNFETEGNNFILNTLVNAVMAETEHLLEHRCSAVSKEYKSVFQLWGEKGLRNAKSTPIKLQKDNYNHISPSMCCSLFPAAFVTLSNMTMTSVMDWEFPLPSSHQHSKHQWYKPCSPLQPVTRGIRLSPLHPTGWTLLEWKLKQSKKFILGDGFHPACLCCAIPQKNLTGPPHNLFFTL